jgi:broad specificity phosphatase PhoE
MINNENFFTISGQKGDSQSLLNRAQFLFMRHGESTSNVEWATNPKGYVFPESFNQKWRDATLTEHGVDQAKS